MLNQMKQLMEMKKQADQLKRELDNTVLEVETVRGIKVTVTGAQTFRAVEIDDSLLDPAHKKRFESDLLRSLNAAVAKAQQSAAQKMKTLMPGFPGVS